MPTRWLVTVPTRHTCHGRTVYGTRSWIIDAFDHSGALGQATELAKISTEILTGPPVARPFTA
ncbi:hypothetical protein ACFV0B_24245 [Streptomyces xanthophaeus]|uniref:hypothetical protein n=1 Tax=Streptomyces xanthophaeus TaxID=67385 RepID=UPI0036CC332E